MFGRGGQGLNISIPYQRSTQPFCDGLMRLSTLEAGDGFTALPVVLKRADDLLYPAILLSQCVFLFLQVLILSLQSLYLPNHLFFSGFGMYLVMA